MSICSLHCSFLHQTPHTILQLCIPQFSPTFLLLSHGFVAIKQKHYCIQFCILKELKSLCSWRTVALHWADSVEVPHTVGSRWLHDTNHAVPALTSTVLSAKCAAHSLIHWHSHSDTNPTTDRWTVTFPSPYTTDTHHCTQCMLFHDP
jgi:hypothetical protein